MDQLTAAQRAQENEYAFPYHYLGLYSQMYRKLTYLPYLYKLKLAKKLLTPFNNRSLLDLGCGDGRFCYEIKSENVRYTGIDFSQRTVSFAKAFNPEARFEVVNSSDFFTDENFDIVVMLDVLEHIPPDQVQDTLKNVQRSLVKNGRFLISVPSTNIPLPKKHYQHYTPKKIISLMPEQLKLVKVIGYGQANYYFNKHLKAVKYATMTWPLRKRIPIINRYIDSIETNWIKNSRCSPENSIDLLALFKKN